MLDQQSVLQHMRLAAESGCVIGAGAEATRRMLLIAIREAAAIFGEAVATLSALGDNGAEFGF